MKKLLVFTLIISVLMLTGCSPALVKYDVVATTLPVYNFTATLCDGTGLHVGRLITESISCLHDYTLQVKQMRMIEEADVTVFSGAGLEGFLSDIPFDSGYIIDASHETHIHAANHHHEHHEHHHEHHEYDPHIWLSPENAKVMCRNIYIGLSRAYPENQSIFQKNLDLLLKELDALQTYGNDQLSSLSCRELITFHDGFAYFAESFDLTILEAIEEESGSEASASEIIHLIELVQSHQIPAVFTETNGSEACATIIQAETGAAVFSLDMAMSGDSYFRAMYHNIDTIKEALK